MEFKFYFGSYTYETTVCAHTMIQNFEDRNLIHFWRAVDCKSEICRHPSSHPLCTALCSDSWRHGDVTQPRSSSPHARTARVLLSLLLPGHLIFVYATCLIESTVLPSALFLLAYLTAAAAQVRIRRQIRQVLTARSGKNLQEKIRETGKQFWQVAGKVDSQGMERKYYPPHAPWE